MSFAIPGLELANLFTGLTRGPDGTGATEAQRTRDLPNFPNQPSWIGAVNGLDVPQTSATFGPGGNVEDFQTFIQGYLTAPESGDYTLYIRSDDPSAFYLSTDASSANLPAIDNPTVYEDGCCRGLGTADGALDEVVTLQAGKIYAFEAYAAEYGGGDYLQVGWTTPSSSQVTVIPGNVLSISTRLPTAQLTITQQPASQTVLQNTPVTFSLTVTGSDPFALGYQWYRNGEVIAGATSSSYTISAVQVADNGARFTVRAVNRNGTYNQPLSSEATLTVSTDNLPPEVLKIVGDAAYTKVSITFNEPVDPTTAQNSANYTVAGLQITAAVLSANGRVVTLTTSSQTPGTRYNVTVNGVADIISANNKISNFQGNFLAWNVARGWLSFQYFANISGNPVANLINSPKFPNSPDATLLLNSFNTPNGYAEAYGARIWGWFYPPTTGDYRFFLRSDDASQLFLNPDGPAEVSTLTGALPIAEETGCCGSFMEPDTGDAATSANTYRLTAGSRYYIEALLKEGTGGDWLQVAYRLEGDPTPAGSLQPIPGAYLGTILDVDVNLQVTRQPTDQLGTVASAGVPLAVEDFNTTDGGYTVENTDPEPPGPWFYDNATGTWMADGSVDGCGGPYNSRLNSPAYTLTQDGAVSLSFNHRYSFEPDLWDAGQVRISVNGGPFTLVPADNFSVNGYAPGNIIGTGIAQGKRAFNGDSPGYATGEFITSRAFLGTLSKNDTLVVQFAGIWDECATGKHPNWVMDSVKLELLPMIIQDFSVNNGSFTVQNSGTPPANWGPWVYSAANGQWVAAGSDPNCGGPFNSKLTSPAYVVPQSDEVTLNFTHRYSLEGDYYDGGQVWISVNGGAFTAVPAESFTANGYATGTIIGTGILKGERAFNGDSAGFATTNFITSSALLGTFNQNDTIVVQFVGAWDECWGPTQPSWVMKNVQLVFGKAAKASTFDVVATATLHGDPVTVAYQWQRNDGAGWVDILGANAASYRIFPTTADFAARFRIVISAPGATITSSETKLVTSLPQTPPEISIAVEGGQIKVTFTGTLQSAANAAGPYANVANAVSPYTVTGTAPMTFFRSVK
ncbi:MAG: Ig-like domain-containing protein [Chloroflexi bacterium]|nr:Ig-like domain-containing protein [Chloroflexota bacterium]